MGSKETLKLVGGSIAVYAIMAACSGTSGVQGVTADGGLGSRALDALADPVGSAAADPYQSGARLKAKYLSGADGSKQFTGWHDSMLNVDCSFVTASDGNMHCLPTGAALAIYFSDSACSQPLGTVAHGCSSGDYIQYNAISGACGGQTIVHVYHAGSLVTPGATVYARLGDTCSSTPTMYLTEYDFYSVGMELAPANYVQATLQTEQ